MNVISATRSAAVAAPPGEVIAYVADPRHLPQWAPAFGARVEDLGDGVWAVAAGSGPSRQVRVRSSAPLGVVDFVSVARPDVGAFLRVLPDGEGSHVTFTIMFAADTDASSVEEEMRGVELELASLRRLFDRAG